MKSWQIFAAGVIVLLAVLFLPSYEHLIAGLAASLMVIVVLLGFFFRPRKEVFYVPTKRVVYQSGSVSIERDRIAVRVELARLWLLFLPTFVAIAFLVITSANGALWRFSLFEAVEAGGWPLLWAIRVFLIVVCALLSCWVTERWVLRNAKACSADSVSALAGRLLYSFKDRVGEYYGGECTPFRLVRSPQLKTIVFYHPDKPQTNIIAMGCLFHRFTVIGHGLTDLDEATVQLHSGRAKRAAQAI